MLAFSHFLLLLLLGTILVVHLDRNLTQAVQFQQMWVLRITVNQLEAYLKFGFCTFSYTIGCDHAHKPKWQEMRKRTSVTHAHASNESTHQRKRTYNNAHANASMQTHVDITQTHWTHERITQTRNSPCPFQTTRWRQTFLIWFNRPSNRSSDMVKRLIMGCLRFKSPYPRFSLSLLDSGNFCIML